ncbi:MAG: RluA family pseudouridine synthase [Deltaproteobacteria bacterium]|nr:RluA family pseudouridine synthase [Deltaproteobacteria bacterium]
MSDSSPGGATRLVCETAGARLDRFVSDHCGPLTRSQTRAIIAAGAVRVNGHRAHKGEMLRVGDVVEIDRTALAPPRPVAQSELDVPVLHQDPHLIALDKPAGMPSVALDGSSRDTVVNFLLALAPETVAAGRSPLEAGLVHRLDTGTSGVLLAARSATAWAAVRAQFGARQVGKRYIALVEGALPRAGAIADPIAHHPRRARAMRVCRESAQAHALGARAARTTYRPLERRDHVTLVEVTIDAGVRHQIRVHLAALGHPICGDTLYGAAPAARLYLHAAALRVRHPFDGRVLSVESPLPGEFSSA